MKRSTIYVDMDGTLLDGSHDAKFIASGYDLTWYDAQYVDGLAVNFRLVEVLVKLRARGHKLVLWTNRGHKQIAMTRANLGGLWFLFEEHQFHAGQKFGTNMDGYTIDNETKYVHNGHIIKGF
jgi:hydroxymethylpyrimidine pyrophosphatase-like HAD family hydrolase